MPKRLFILWREGDSRSYTDVLFEDQLFDPRQNGAELDYGGEFQKQNEKAGMIIGVLFEHHLTSN